MKKQRGERRDVRQYNELYIDNRPIDSTVVLTQGNNVPRYENDGYKLKVCSWNINPNNIKDPAFISITLDEKSNQRGN